MEAIKEVQNTISTKQDNNIIVNYFKDYGAAKTYYKAAVIYNTDFIRLQLKILRSYNTEVAVYNYSNGVLLLNNDFYNCSKTTKEHLDFFKVTETSLITRTIYLSDNEFNRLLNYFYMSDVGAYELSEYEFIKKYDYQKSVIDTLTCSYLSVDEKIDELLHFNILEQQTQVLKTRFKKIDICEKAGVKFEVTTTWKKTPETCKYDGSDLISKKIKLLSEVSYYHDHVKQQDKLLYGGCDMGITNTKSLFV